MKAALWLWLCLTPALLHAQPAPDTLWTRWMRVGPFARSSAVEVCADSSMVIAGDGTTESWAQGLFLKKLAPGGQVIWERFHYANHPQIKDMIRTEDGGWVVTGSVRGGASDDPRQLIVAKYDSTGQEPWRLIVETAENWEGKAVIQTFGGSYMVLASFWLETDASWQLVLLRVDGFGSIVWLQELREYGISHEPWGIVQTEDGGFVMGGCAWEGSGIHPFLAKVDLNGYQIWSRTYPYSLYRQDGAFIPAAEGGYLLTAAGILPGAGTVYNFLLRMDATGEPIWPRWFGSGWHNIPHAVAESPDGGFVVTGQYRPTTDPDGQSGLLKVSGSGDSLWSRTFVVGNGNEENPWDVACMPDGGYVLTGDCSRTSTVVPFVVRTAPDVLSAAPAPRVPLPQTLAFAAYPNPFNAVTTLSFNLPTVSPAQLAIYDITGREVWTRNALSLPAGSHTVGLSAAEWASGIYFARLSAAGTHAEQKLLLIR